MTIRLKTISELISKNDTMIADIGSDHGFLSLLVAKNNSNITFYNIEKNQKPLENSIKNTNKYPNIINVLNDGLSNWSKTKHFDVVCISGLGGNSIIRIIKNLPKNLEIKKMILIPNNNQYKLRKFLSAYLWKFYYESWIVENKINYPIMVISKNEGYKYQNEKDWYFGKLNWVNPSEIFNKFYKARLKYILNNNLDKYNKKYAKEVKLINEYFANKI